MRPLGVARCQACAEAMGSASPQNADTRISGKALAASWRVRSMNVITDGVETQTVMRSRKRNGPGDMRSASGTTCSDAPDAQPR